MYSVVTTNNNKTVSARTVSTAAQESRTLFCNSESFTGLTDAVLIESGSIPSDAIGASNTIVLPYQSSVTFGPNGSNKFQATLTTRDTRGGRALCTFLNSGDKEAVITGPLGSEYTLPAAADIDCAAGVLVVYER